MKKDSIAVEGIVEDTLPNCQFTVKLSESGQKVLGYLSGKMKQNFIRITKGDFVTVELSPYDLKKGRITYRK